MNANIKLILLIDDSEDDNFFHRRAIKKGGLTCQVDVCTSGDKAMDYLTCQGDYADNAPDFPKPDLIFLDINMPRVNGWEFMELYNNWLDANEFCPAAIIVMLSTSTQLSDKQRAESIPRIAGYVEKPLKPELINGIIEAHFRNAAG